MKNIILLFIFCSIFFKTGSFAQMKTDLPNSAITEVEVSSDQYLQKRFAENNRFHFVTKIPVPVSNDGPFINFSVSWEVLGEEGKVEKFLFRDEKIMKSLPLNHHVEKPSDELNSELAFIKAESERLVLKVVTNGKPALKMKIHFYNPGFTTSVENKILETTTSKSLTCPCPQPTVMTRSDWCPAGNCPENSNPTTTIATHLIIHHSAGVNTSSDWPAVVRGIWNYHVNTLGWNDVGYNWLVDAEGNLYEGRGKDEQGAHFCGTNSATAGICMLGTFTDVAPQAASIETLKRMLAWYSCTDDIDPLGVSNHSGSGLNLNNISGHRDGCSTECPGNTFYPSIADLRMTVSDHINQVCGSSLPDVIVASIEASPDPFYTDEVTSLSTTITNQGNVIAENINVTLSLDGNLLSNIMLQSLDPGASSSFSNTYVFQETGTAEFCVNVDPVANEIEIENNNSCLEMNVESLVNVNDFAAAQLSIFPNPTSGYFIIKNESNKTGELIIYNSLGQTIQSVDLSNQSQQDFNLSEFPKGVYFLKVKIESVSYLEKIVIE